MAMNLIDLDGLFKKLEEYYGRNFVRLGIIVLIILVLIIWAYPHIHRAHTDLLEEQNTLGEISTESEEVSSEKPEPEPVELPSQKMKPVPLPTKKNLSGVALGNEIQIEGKLHSIDTRRDGYSLSVDLSRGAVRCFSEKKEMEKFSMPLITGGRIVLRGIVTRRSEVSARIEDCAVVEYELPPFAQAPTNLLSDVSLGDEIQVTGHLVDTLHDFVWAYSLTIGGHSKRVQLECTKEQFERFPGSVSINDLITVKGKVNFISKTLIGLRDCQVIEYFRGK